VRLCVHEERRVSTDEARRRARPQRARRCEFLRRDVRCGSYVDNNAHCRWCCWLRVRQGGLRPPTQRRRRECRMVAVCC
jgi:hypothetical protein